MPTRSSYLVTLCEPACRTVALNDSYLAGMSEDLMTAMGLLEPFTKTPVTLYAARQASNKV
jgi:hypothetical protein